MILAQLTDLHVRPRGMAAMRACETNMLSERAFRAVAAFRPKIDAVMITGDLVANGQEVLASVALSRAITTAPAVVGTLLAGLQTGVVTIPLVDAHPSDVVLVGRNDRRSPPVETMLAFFRSLDGE